MSKILVVEDDYTFANLVKDALERNSYSVDVVENGEDGLYWLQHNNYALVILDCDLPKLTGPELCHRYRCAGGLVPILMLTGKSESRDIVRGLDAGADDYLCKPIEIGLLMAHIRAILRRPSETKTLVLSVGDIELDPAKLSVIVNGNFVEMPPKEFRVLEFLMHNQHKPCTTEELLDHVWPTNSETLPESVKSIVCKLRTKLDKARSTLQIRNVYGMGYRLENTGNL